MRVAIASRIFEPEPSAASFRLAALATAFAEADHDVTVLTVRPPKGSSESSVLRPESASPLAPVAQRAASPTPRAQRVETQALPPYRVKRFPVLRDKTGYVRGYVQYMSFDIPLFFRILFGPRRDAIVVEPPPTTLFFATVAARLRRIPVFAYAADVWSDASESTGAPSAVVRVVRWMERFGWRLARGVYAVNDGVAARVREIAPTASVRTVGNGIDTAVFCPEGPAAMPGAAIQAASEELPGDYVIYTGTASEWQGADVFVRAIAELARAGSALRLVFLGQGTAIPELQQLAAELNAPVVFHDTVPPEQAAAWLRGARVSVASIRPDAGYDFAYPTKIFASWACGTPVVYAGPGPARAALAAESMLGIGVDYDVDAVMTALTETASRAEERESIAAWAAENVSLRGVADRAVVFTGTRLTRKPGA